MCTAIPEGKVHLNAELIFTLPETLEPILNNEGMDSDILVE